MAIPGHSKKTPKTVIKNNKGKSTNGEQLEQLEAWIENVTNDSDENKRIIKQILLGGFSGWFTGFICMKVGKITATAIGGGIILLQIANSKGYIKVNWNRVNRDFEDVTNKIQKEAFGKKKLDWADKLEKKAISLGDKSKNFFQRLVYSEDDRMRNMQLFFTSFTVGIGLGLIMGH